MDKSKKSTLGNDLIESLTEALETEKLRKIDVRIIQAFIERGIFKNKNEVISAALKALVREQRQADSEKQNAESLVDQITYEIQKQRP